MKTDFQVAAQHPTVMARQNHDFGKDLYIEDDLVLNDWKTFKEQVEERVTKHLYVEDENNAVVRAMDLLKSLLEKQAEQLPNNGHRVADQYPGVKFHLQIRSKEHLRPQRHVVVLIRSWTLNYFSDPFFSSEFPIFIEKKVESLQ